MKIESYKEISQFTRLANIEIGFIAITKISIDPSADKCSLDDTMLLNSKASESNLVIPVYRKIGSADIIPIMSFDSVVKEFNLPSSDKESFRTILSKICELYGCTFKNISILGSDRFFIIKSDQSNIISLSIEFTNTLKYRYDEVHYTSQILYISEIIKRMSQIDTDGSIRKLNLKEIDNIFDKVKSNIEIA